MADKEYLQQYVQYIKNTARVPLTAGLVGEAKERLVLLRMLLSRDPYPVWYGTGLEAGGLIERLAAALETLQAERDEALAALSSARMAAVCVGISAEDNRPVPDLIISIGTRADHAEAELTTLRNRAEEAQKALRAIKAINLADFPDRPHALLDIAKRIARAALQPKGEEG